MCLAEARTGVSHTSAREKMFCWKCMHLCLFLQNKHSPDIHHLSSLNPISSKQQHNSGIPEKSKKQIRQYLLQVHLSHYSQIGYQIIAE